MFLLWERKAEYSRGDTKHSEDICGVTYVKMSHDGKASAIATFRQPSPVRPDVLLCALLHLGHAFGDGLLPTSKLIHACHCTLSCHAERVNDHRTCINRS